MSSFDEIMTILDETIEKAEQLEESISTQIADAENRGYNKAYEELESKYQELIYQAETNIRNKTIDDCKELTYREVVYTDSLNDRTEFRELLEQLKEEKK